jgi:AcrR family transcriptional regulator
MAASKHNSEVPRSRSRGRQPTFDREKALETALDLFWRHGYEGVSINDLTQKIGIAAPSLYHAFGSKAKLFREVIHRYQSMGLPPSQIKDAESSFEATRKVLEFSIAAVTRSKCPPGCMVTSGLLITSPEHADLAAHLREERAKLRRSLQKRIEWDIREGILDSSVNAANLARFYTSVLQGISTQAIDGATPVQLIAIMQTALLAWPAERKRAAQQNIRGATDQPKSIR